MSELDFIILLTSFNGVAGSLLGFYIVPQTREQLKPPRVAAFIALLFWFSTFIALITCPYTQFSILLYFSYWLTIFGTSFAIYLMLRINVEYTFYPLLKAFFRELEIMRKAEKS